MPPPRSRPPPDDSRSEASSTKEKNSTGTNNASNGKGRRVGGNQAAGSLLRDAVTSGQNNASTSNATVANPDVTPGVSIVMLLSYNQLTLADTMANT